MYCCALLYLVSIWSSCICKVLNSQDWHCCIYSWNSPLYMRQWRPQEWLSKLAPMTLIHPWSIQSPLERESLVVCLCGEAVADWVGDWS